jgi:hypothetical protein
MTTTRPTDHDDPQPPAAPPGSHSDDAHHERGDPGEPGDSTAATEPAPTTKPRRMFRGRVYLDWGECSSRSLPRPTRAATPASRTRQPRQPAPPSVRHVTAS